MNSAIIDIGNSALKWSPLNEEVEFGGYPHLSERKLNPKIFDELEKRKIRCLYGTFVAGKELKEEIESFMQMRGGACCWFCSEKEFNGPFTLSNNYDNPQQLGSDRWHGAIGAVQKYPHHSIILVQFGTATTVDVVKWLKKEEYRYEGGLILPGINLMFQSLEQKVPALAVKRGSESRLPKNTSDAITNGIFDAQIGSVYLILKELEKKVSRKLIKVILTGGAAKTVEPWAHEVIGDFEIAHNIVLTGTKLRALEEIRQSSSQELASIKKSR